MYHYQKKIIKKFILLLEFYIVKQEQKQLNSRF